MHKYNVIAHRRVHKFLSTLRDENSKNAIKNDLAKLEDYPVALRDMDVEKIKGAKDTFRLRVGKYRAIFHVDKTEKTIYVTHIEARKKVYEKI